jgi:hypothetical protein
MKKSFARICCVLFILCWAGSASGLKQVMPILLWQLQNEDKYKTVRIWMVSTGAKSEHKENKENSNKSRGRCKIF